MTRDELVSAIAKDAQKRATVKDGVSVRVAYLREAEAVLESIEAAGWTVVPLEGAQAHSDSAVLDALTRPSIASLTPLKRNSRHLLVRVSRRQIGSFTEFLQRWPIDDGDGASPGGDVSFTFQRLHRYGGTGPVHAEHDRKQLVRERQRGAVETIIYHEQPTGQPLLDITTMGQGCLGGLKMKSEGVVQKRPVQAGTLLHSAVTNSHQSARGPIATCSQMISVLHEPRFSSDKQRSG